MPEVQIPHRVPNFAHLYLLMFICEDELVVVPLVAAVSEDTHGVIGGSRRRFEESCRCFGVTVPDGNDTLRVQKEQTVDERLVLAHEDLLLEVEIVVGIEVPFPP